MACSEAMSLWQNVATIGFGFVAFVLICLLLLLGCKQ